MKRRGARSVAVAAVAACAACEPQQAAVPGGHDAAPVAVAPAPDASAAAAETANPSLEASAEASARAAQWKGALTAAIHLPCRAIAVDGVVRVEPAGDAGPERLDHNAELPGGVWVSLAADSRLVAKDPRTTRETTFVGASRVRPCVTHREESWIASGSFESAIGAGETPGAEEWVVTPLAVIRYMAAKLRVDVRPAETLVSVGSGDAFLWLADDAREVRAPRGADAGGASATIDDEGWRRTSDTPGGALKLVAAAGHPPADAARAIVDRCGSLTKRARDLAGELISGPADADGGTAKEQVKTRRIARAACAVAALRVAALPPSPARDALSAALNAGSLDR